MNQQTKILSIIGSPQKKGSNTKTMVEDFVEELALAGLNLEHTIITLGEKTIKPCIGCWNCTQKKPCPLRDDDLAEIKEAMIDCDLLILGSPVYTNQITAQMKALFDRLFTWCHIFPLLGKYSLSAVLTGQEGIKPVSDFIQKMLATYGTFHLGTIESMGGFTPGFFPFREKAREKNKKLAQKVAEIITHHSRIPVSSLQNKMFKIMSRKMQGTNIFRYISDHEDKSPAEPPAFLLKLVQKKLAQNHVSKRDIQKIASMMSFEYSWWIERNWFKAKSFKDLLKTPVPAQFDIKKHLL